MTRKVSYKKYRKGPGAIRFQFIITDAILIGTREQRRGYYDHERKQNIQCDPVTVFILKKIGKRGGPVGKPFEVYEIFENDTVHSERFQA